MKDYGKIITKIGSTPWLMTPDGLKMVLGIVDRHIQGMEISDEDLETIRLQADNRGGTNGKVTSNSGIGVIPVHGPIFGKANLMTDMSGATSLESFTKNFRSMVDSQDISSIILDFDTPGGTSDLVQETGAEIFNARGSKPIYSIANTQAGSAGLWLASQADKFYATPSGMVGSLGAVAVHTDQSESDKNEGLKYTFISAGKYKVEGNTHEPLTAEAEAYRQGVIDELYAEFVDAVASGRNMSVDKVKNDFGNGRMLTPKNAVIAGMVDGIRTFDELVSEVQSEPQQVSVSLAGSNVRAMATLSDGVANLSAEGFEILLGESKEWEHSEPGTGSPPAPRTDQDGSDDKAITHGWRREIPPENDHSISPSPPPVNSNLWSANANEGGEMETVQEQLYKLLGATSDDDLLNKVTAMHAESTALRSAVHASTEEMRLAEEFPHFWASTQERIGKERTRDAKDFVTGVSMFTRLEGDKQVKSGFGLSALVMDELEKFHLEFAQGKASLASFEEVMNTMAHGGVVDYTEQGSATGKDAPRVFDTSTPVGLQSARAGFAAVVASVMDEWEDDAKYDKMTYQEKYGLAVAEAATREPEMATAYRTASPGQP